MKTEIFETDDDTAQLLSNHVSFSVKLKSELRPLQRRTFVFLMVRHLIAICECVLFLREGCNRSGTSVAKAFSCLDRYKVKHASNLRVVR